MNDEIKLNLEKRSLWERIFYMLVLAVVVSMIVNPLLWVVVLLQIVTNLLAGHSNANVLAFGRSLSCYLFHINQYLTFNTEVVPFPFSSWQATEQFDVPGKKAADHNDGEVS